VSPLGFVRGAVAVAVLVVLHFTLRPLLGWRAPIDFLVIAALVAAVRLRPGMAALLGLVLGLAADAMTPAAFGSGALALSAVAFAASYLKAIFFADNLALGLLFFFAGKWTFDVLYLVSERRLRGTELVVQLLLWSPLAATVTAVAGVLLLLALRPVLGRAQA
jgi:rod shape-determining protein MreD